MQEFAPIGTDEFGDGYGAVEALEARHRLDEDFRMKALHDKLASLEVTTSKYFNPPRVTQEMRRICLELGHLGDELVSG